MEVGYLYYRAMAATGARHFSERSHKLDYCQGAEMQSLLHALPCHGRPLALLTWTCSLQAAET
jgi:hypothetical protein